MATRNNILRTARGQIGYREKNSNITKYWAELYPQFQGAPWCAAFTAWVYKQNGSDLLLTGPSAPYYTPSMEAWAKKTGRWKESKDCLPGDVLIFGGRGAVHTGILERQDGPNHVISIEGNTSNGSGGSQTDGGGVYRRRRPRSWIRGCISMSTEMTNTDSLGGGMTASIPQGPVRLDEDGEFGPLTAKALEKYLGQPVNGDLDRMTVRALQSWVHGGKPGVRTGRLSKNDIRAFQKKVSAKVDGEWGPNTTFGLQRYLNRRNGFAVK